MLSGFEFDALCQSPGVTDLAIYHAFHRLARADAAVPARQLAYAKAKRRLGWPPAVPAIAAGTFE